MRNSVAETLDEASGDAVEQEGLTDLLGDVENFDMGIEFGGPAGGRAAFRIFDWRTHRRHRLQDRVICGAHVRRNGLSRPRTSFYSRA